MEMSTVDIKAELKDLIDQETNLSLLEAVKVLLAQGEYDVAVEKEMVSRALKSEEDIKEGRVLDVDEADARLNSRLGL